MLVFPCQIQHTICVDCFVRYCSVYLNERRFIQTEEHGYSIACPGNFGKQLNEFVTCWSLVSDVTHTMLIIVIFFTDDCQTSFIKDPHHFRLMGDDQVNVKWCDVQCAN